MATRSDRLVPVHEDASVHALMGATPAVQVEMMRARGLEDAVVLVLSNSCASRCFFCASPGTTAVPSEDVSSFAQIRAHLETRPPHVTRLLVGGNEPTLHPDFERTLAHAQASGFTHVELMSSGLRFAEAGALARWRECGLSAVAVPIYAPTAELHDAVCGAPAFDVLVRGLDAARDAGLELHLHTLLLRRTSHALPELASLVSRRWRTALAVAPLRDKSQLFRFADEAVSLEETRKILASVEAPLTRLGLPTCAARERPRASTLVMQVYFQTQRRSFGTGCTGCADRDACPGVVDGELAAFGERGLAPRSPNEEPDE